MAFSFLARLRSDHPRSRGEYNLWDAAGSKEDGSSPLSRGIPVSRNEQFGLPGIIPALAGNTSRAVASSSRASDHPRSRGEYAATQGISVAVGGSSPLSRGIPCLQISIDLREGIIPALAGNTQ